MNRKHKIVIGIIGFLTVMMLANSIMNVKGLAIPSTFSELTNSVFQDDYSLLQQESTLDNNYRNYFYNKEVNSIPSKVVDNLFLYPNIDIIDDWDEWDYGFTSNVHWEYLCDDDLNSRIQSNVANDIDRFGFTTITIDGIIERIDLHYIANAKFFEIPSQYYLEVRIGSGGSFGAWNNVYADDNLIWRIHTFAELSYDQNDINNFQIEFNSKGSDSYLDYIYEIYVEIFYSELDDSGLFQEGIKTESIQDVNYGIVQSKSIYSDSESWKTSNGCYNASYSFENDIIDNNFVIENVGSNTIELKDIVDSHSNVLEISDNAINSHGTISDTLNTPQENGTIEFYVLFTTLTDYQGALFKNELNQGSGYFSVCNGKFQSYYSDAWHDIFTPIINTWYHIKYEFDCSNNLIDVYIDGILKLNGLMRYTSTTINVFYVNTHTSNIQKMYIDAIGYSWLDNYTIDDNLMDVITSETDGKYQEKVSCEYFLTDVLIGTIQISINIVKNGVESIYINNYDDSSILDNLYYSIDLFPLINITELEFIFHFYNGLNDISLNAINYRIEIIPNNNITLEWSYENSFICSANEMNIDYVSRYYLAFTQLSRYYNNLYGLRQLVNIGTHNSFIDLPLFYINIDFPIPIIPPPPIIEPSGTYWLYTTYYLDFSINETWEFNTTIEGNENFKGEQLNFTYSLLLIRTETEKFYYTTIPYSQGNWWDIFLNALIFVLNLFWTGLQLIIYFFWIVVSFLVMFLLIGVIGGFFWNFVIKYLVYAGLWVILWFLPIAEWLLGWLLEIFIPILTNIIIIIFSVVITGLLWVISFGTADWDLLYTVVNDFFTLIGNFVVDTFTTFIEYLPYFFMYVSAFIILIGLGYIKIFYCKAKGYTNRVAQIEQSIDTYLYPFKQGKKIVKGVKESVPLL